MPQFQARMAGKQTYDEDVAGVQLLPLALVALDDGLGSWRAAGGGTYCIFPAVVFVPHKSPGSFCLHLSSGAPSISTAVPSRHGVHGLG